MRFAKLLTGAGCVGLLSLAALSRTAAAGAPSTEQALGLSPVQKGVDCDTPSAEQISKCKVNSYKEKGEVGWIVESPDGVRLRKFADTNGDNMVDQWSYYKDGLEVYRDIDSNANGKADQYRWFHTAGTRWGLDSKEDGEIDSWKAISAEEVSAEVVAAMIAKDPARFARVALSAKELQGLGLGEARTKQVTEKIGALKADFTKLVAQQKTVTAATRWLQFSANPPGTIPAGTAGSSADVTAYESAVAIVETAGQSAQILVGTLIRVGDGWRVIDLPHVIGEGSAAATAGFFFQGLPASRPQAGPGAPGEAAQKLIDALTELDSKGPAQANYHVQRADLLEKLVETAASPEERDMWTRELANGVTAAVQDGGWPEGVKRLEALYEKLKEGDSKALPYVHFRLLFSKHALQMAAKGADTEKLMAEWLKTLEQFVEQYPGSADAAEAMLQLAMNYEMNGQEEPAAKWYERIAKQSPDSPAGRRSSGALTRLHAEGKSLAFHGQTLKNESLDLAKLQGRVVLLAYWATWCEPCKTEMPALKELVAKYGKSGFSVIGVSLDHKAQDVTDFLAENPVPWPVVFEEGGLDSRPATALGIVQLPTMLLIDRSGKVLKRNVRVADLGDELKQLLK